MLVRANNHSAPVCRWMYGTSRETVGIALAEHLSALVQEIFRSDASDLSSLVWLKIPNV